MNPIDAPAATENRHDPVGLGGPGPGEAAPPEPPGVSPPQAPRTAHTVLDAAGEPHPDPESSESVVGGHRQKVEASTPAAAELEQRTGYRPTWIARLWYRIEVRISRLSTRNNFWHRVCSLIWLPLAFRSGIKIQKGSESTFSAVLPFRRFNRNWYSAMAGGALLGNSEVACGMFVFGKCGGDYTVVCKSLEYKFLRPCFGPAVYRIEPREDIEQNVRNGGEFNITIDMCVVQMVQARNQTERRVGTCTATFHVTPKAVARARRLRRPRPAARP